MSDFMSRPFARVWGRPIGDLELVVLDPVGSGLMHAPRALDDAQGAGVVEPPKEAVTPARRRSGMRGEAGGGVEGPRRLVLRPAWGRDHAAIDDVRRANSAWLRPWEATLPPESREKLPDLAEYQRATDRDQRLGKALIMLVEADGRVVGQFALSNVQGGAMSQGMLGYWLAREWAGRGLGTLGAALVIDLVIGELGLHRVEVDVRPENGPSLGLCRRLGLHYEGRRPRFMHINGAWADHLCFSIDAESLPEGGLVRGRLLGDDLRAGDD